MRIKVLVNLGAGLPKFTQDSEQDVSDSLGLMLIKRHWAIQLPSQPVIVEPVKETPAPDKFQAMREQPDHIQKPPRRKSKPAKELDKQGE